MHGQMLHWSRFSRLYRALFGELPSDTRGRAQSAAAEKQ
jgi:transcriptional regulator GlxA family with amidase domain